MHTKIVCIVGKKKSGKTTFLEKLVPALTGMGLSVGTVKHDAHEFDMDHEGKDSWRHARAGAASVVVSSPSRLALIKRVEQETPLTEIVSQFMKDRQIILAEGYYRSDLPKLEVHRSEAHEQPLTTPENAADKRVLAVVTEDPLDLGVPILGLDDAEDAARLIMTRVLGL